MQEVAPAVYNFYRSESSGDAPRLRRACLGGIAFEVAGAKGRAVAFEQTVAYALSEAGAPESPGS